MGDTLGALTATILTLLFATTLPVIDSVIVPGMVFPGDQATKLAKLPENSAGKVHAESISSTQEKSSSTKCSCIIV